MIWADDHPWYSVSVNLGNFQILMDDSHNNPKIWHKASRLIKIIDEIKDSRDGIKNNVASWIYSPCQS